MSKIHNKSKLDMLSILTLSEDVLAKCRSIMTFHKIYGRNKDSPCLMLSSKDGRISIKSKKVCYGYTLVALDKFGREVLEKVPPNKNADSPTISHLCGTEYCCNSDHMTIESKSVNDERVHCHFCLANVFRHTGQEGIRQFRLIKCCCHIPICIYWYCLAESRR